MNNLNMHLSNKLLKSEQWFDMKQAAKLIDAGMGRTKLFNYLRNQGFLMNNNEPYQEFIDEGIFKLVLKDIHNRSGKLLFRQLVTLVSDKGIQFIKQFIVDNQAN